ncbi:class I SAM-dependent methyltransferase [Actinocrispum sp. NPDC049592]|uniref:class I SAM-dependent methyltransferase n=1 Tax=Actinocrispum sp. NPDC049592 TaxID=3154835 RepID=UPI003435E8D6
MPDEEFTHPRLAAIYDALDPDRSDLDPYVAIVESLGARSVLDVGCGTGTFAVMLAERGLSVAGVDPAAASVDIARAKSPAVRWIVGDATTLPPLQVDVATMTANVAQAIPDLGATLRGICAALRPGGHVVFETRDPALRGWEEWTFLGTRKVTKIPGVGPVESWADLVDVSLPRVTFRWNFVFLPKGEVLRSESTLWFRSREEVTDLLAANGFTDIEVRDAPDRPGREFVFLATAATDGRPPRAS